MYQCFTFQKHVHYSLLVTYFLFVFIGALLLLLLCAIHNTFTLTLTLTSLWFPIKLSIFSLSIISDSLILSFNYIRFLCLKEMVFIRWIIFLCLLFPITRSIGENFVACAIETRACLALLELWYQYNTILSHLWSPTEVLCLRIRK